MCKTSSVILMFIFFILIGCEKNSDISEGVEIHQSQEETIVLNKLNDFVASQSNISSDTKSNTGRIIKSIDKISIKSSVETKSTDNYLIEHSAYIVNYSNGQGFAIIGISKDEPIIIAYSEDGNIDSKSLSLAGDTDNTFFKQIIINGIINDIDDYMETKSSSGCVVPLLKTLWTQETSNLGVEYNKYCYMTRRGNNNNHVPCGCSILAGAMIIAYNGYPTSFTINGRCISWYNISHYAEPNGNQAAEDAALLIGQFMCVH